MKVLPSVLVSSAALLLANCAYGPSGGRIGEAGQVQVVHTDSLPEPTPIDAVQKTRAYLVGPLDILVVDVLGVEEIKEREIVVDNAGRISIPLVGSILAVGNTPEQLAAQIQSRLRQNYMRDPQVSVNLKESKSQFVTVEGQVFQPGNYPILGDMRLTRAVASAKGLAEFAELENIVVLRTVSGRRYAGVYNLAAIRRGNYPDPEIYANDVVVVGDSAARRRMKDLLTALPVLTTPLIYLLPKL